MKINRQELLKALKAVQPGLASKEVIEQSTSFVFTEDGQVVTYNDEIAVSHPIKVNFTGAVPAKEFYSYVDKVKAEEIEFIATDCEIQLKGSRAKAGLRLDTVITLPILDLAQPEDSDWKKLPKTFCDAMSFCLFSVSRDETKPVLTCLHVKGQFVESTDNYRITRYDMGETAAKSFKSPLLIPAYAARSIIGYKPVQFAKTEGWLHFKNDEGLQFSCRIFDEEFPNIEPLLNAKGKKVQFPSTLTEIMDRANVFSGGERITIAIADKKMLISSEGDVGWFKEDARVAYDADPIYFDIAPEFMKSIMKVTDTAEISERVLKFTGDSFIHIVALVKTKAKGEK